MSVVAEPSVGSILLEGVVAGVTVVIGVGLAEVFARVRWRRERIETWVAELGLTLPRWLSHFTGRSNFPNPLHPEFPRLHESVVSATTGIRFNARFPMRRRVAIRDEVEDLSARIMAVYLRYNQGTPLIDEEMLYITVSKVRDEVLGKRHETLEKRFERYVDEGIPTDDPDD